MATRARRDGRVRRMLVAAGVACALAAPAAMAESIPICQGIWSQNEVSGARSPGSIDISFKPVTATGSIAISTFNYLDNSLIARNLFKLSNPLICTEYEVDNNICNSSEIGKFHVLPPLDGAALHAYIMNERVLWAPPNTKTPVVSKSRLSKRQGAPPPSSNSTTSALSSTSTLSSSSSSLSSSKTTTSSSSSTTSTTASQSPSPLPTPDSFIKNSSLSFHYEVKESGYYCVLFSTDLTEKVDYTFNVVVSNPYGLLPALFYPALVFYGVMSMAYLAVGVVWMILSFRSWKELLPIQSYVSGVIAFLILEMAFNYGLYENYNTTGQISTLLLALTVTFNAGRISISFFMLLIVSLGYNVVRPNLGDTMKRCVFLTILHFAFGVSYSTLSLTSKDQNSSLMFFLAIPLSLTMTAFYTWTFTALTETMQRLELRRQSVKLLMYRQLWYILSASAVALMLVIVANSINLSHRNNPEWIATQWKWRWMLLDGSMNIIYFFVFVSISVLWRPTDNNQRYGLDQLAQDDPDQDPNGIKLHDVRDTFDDDELQEFEEEFGDHEADGNETADDVLRWVEQNVGGVTTHAVVSSGAAMGGSGPGIDGVRSQSTALGSSSGSGARVRAQPHTSLRMDTNEQLSAGVSDADAEAMRQSKSSDLLISK